jgi:vitamin B12 transporter
MKNFTILAFLLFISLSALGQTIINGRVLDPEAEPVAGANVFVEGSYDGATTGIDGTFSFRTFESGQSRILASFIGYKEEGQEVLLNGDSLFLTYTLKEDFQMMKAAVITAGSFEAGDEKKAVILKPLDIATTAGATADIAGALNTLPGTQRVGETGQLFVRGGAASETRTYIDGLRVQNPYNSTVPDMPARGRFSPFLFKGTMFSTGGYSAEYGQALSSALILNTQDLPAKTVTGLSLMSVGASLSHTQRWENTSLAVSGDYTNLGPYTGIIRQDIEWEKPFQGTGGQLVFRHKPSKDGMLKVFGSFNHNDMAMQYPDLSDVRKVNRLELDNANYYGNVSWQELLSDKWSFFAGAAFTRNADEIQEQFQLNNDHQSLQGRVRLGYHPTEMISIKFGGELLYDDWQEAYQASSDELYETRLKERYGASFAEANIYLNNHFTARAGVRMEYSSLLDEWNLAPRLSLAYKSGEHSQFSLAYGHFYQTPEQELMRYTQDFDFEQAEHYMLNYQYSKDKRTFRIEGYYKNYRQLVKFDAERPWISSNSGKGYAYGLDVFFRDQKTIKNGDYWVSYSFLDTRRDFRDFPEIATPAFASAHNLSLVYKHWLPKLNTQIGITYSFASGRPYEDPMTPGFNTERTPVYQDLSVNLSYLTHLFGNFTIVYASVSNLPGFKQTFGYRFSPDPNNPGQFNRLAVQPPAPRFAFVGVFVSLGRKSGGNE